MKLLLAVIALDLTVCTGILIYEFVVSLNAPAEISFHIQPEPQPSAHAEAF